MSPIALGNDKILLATRAALARARRRGSEEVTQDDLLAGLLQAVARFGVALVGEWAIDLEALGETPADKAPGGARLKPAYTPETAAIFDRAATIARTDGARNMGPVHLLAAFAPEEGGLMGRLKSTYGFTGAEWRAALARWSPGEAGDGAAPPAGNDAHGGRDLLSPDEAAAFLGVHTQTVRGYIRAGKLPAYRIAGERSIRIRREDLLALLEPLSPEEAGLPEEAE